MEILMVSKVKKKKKHFKFITQKKHNSNLVY